MVRGLVSETINRADMCPRSLWERLKIGQRSVPLLWPWPWAARAWRSRKGEAFKKRGRHKPPTLLRRAARVPLMLVMRAPAGSPARTRKLEISW